MIEREIGNLERFLDVLSKRNTVLASNIANADTPGYRAKDVDFRKALREAVEQGPPREGASEGKPAKPEIYETPAVNPSRDGNTVSMELEMIRMSENTMLYNTFAQVAAIRLAIIKSALSNTT